MRDWQLDYWADYYTRNPQAASEEVYDNDFAASVAALFAEDDHDDWEDVP